MIPSAPISDCILIAGYYGYGNTGDEAILSAIVQELRIITPDAHLIVLSGNPPETAARFGVEAFHANDAVARLDAIERSRLVIIGGGGLFHDYWGLPSGTLFAAGTWGMSLFLTIALYAALRRVPVMLWALGVGPLLSEEGRAVASAICRLATVITVRDANSCRELEAIGVPRDRIRITADPVFSTPPAPKMSAAVRDIIGRAANGNWPLIGVCLRRWDVVIEPTFWETRVAEALDLTAASTGASVVFIPFQACQELHLDDVGAASRVRAAMRSETRTTILHESLDVRETWTLIGACNCVMGMRLHAGVAAATRGVPLVTLSYDPKVTALMDELGVPGFNMEIGRVDAKGLAELLTKSLAEGAALQRTLGDACIRLGIRARQNASAAGAILSRTAAATPATGLEPFDTFLAETLRNQVCLIAAAAGQARPAEAVPPIAYEPPIEYEPIISVVLPVWNHKRFVATAIRSVLTQTWRNLELIIIDDGSDDGLSPELGAAIENDPRARVVRRSHEGLPRSLSSGFRLAQGDLLTWVSADNILRPDALASMAHFLLMHPKVAMVYADMDLIDGKGKPLTGSDYRVSAQRPEATNQLRLPRAVETLGLAEDNFIGACFLYRAEMARLLGDYDASRVGVEDYDYWLRIAAAAHIAHLDSDECLCSYRVHDDSISVRQAGDIVRDVPNLLQHHRARLSFYEQAFHVAIVVDTEMPGLGATAANLAGSLRRMRHDVTEFDLANAREGVRSWAGEIAGAKKVAVYFGNCPEACPSVLSFEWLSATSAPQGADGPRMLCSSKRLAGNRWPLLPASTAAYDDLLLCMKARGTAYPMWDLPRSQSQLFLYLGPVRESCIDWAAVEFLAGENPDATILFVSTDAEHRYDPRIRFPKALYLGPRPQFHWYGYLSRAHLLIAPFSDSPGVEDLAYDVLMRYLAAGKSILTTPMIQLIGFADLPNSRISEATEFGDAARRALRINPDLDLAGAYMESKSSRAFAESFLAVANNELYK